MYRVKFTVYAVPGFTCCVVKDGPEGETLVGWFCDREEARQICAVLNTYHPATIAA